MSTPPAEQDTVVYGAWVSRRFSRRARAPRSARLELKWLTNWLSFLWKLEFPWRVDNVHGRSLRDSLSLCSVTAPVKRHVHLRVRHCVHLVVPKLTPGTSRFHVLTTSPRLPDSDRKTSSFFDSSIVAVAKHARRSLSQFFWSVWRHADPPTCVQCSHDFHPV